MRAHKLLIDPEGHALLAASAVRERAASVAADVKLTTGLSAAALSAGRAASKQNPAR